METLFSAITCKLGIASSDLIGTAKTRSFALSFATVTAAMLVATALGQAPPALQRQTVVTVLSPHGFEPPHGTVSVSDVRIRIINRSGDESLSFDYNRVVGAAEARERIDRGLKERKKSSFAKVLSLTPGQYIVSVEEHPDWTYRLTVTSARR
jgi:hypothetical protein